MFIVDTHCHTGTNKYEPVEALMFHMEQANVSKAVLIQHAGNTDNSYHVQCIRSYPNRFAAAMIVETTDTGEKIDFWAQNIAIKGMKNDFLQKKKLISLCIFRIKKKK